MIPLIDQKQQLVEKVIKEYGIKRLFIELGLERVSQDGDNISSVCCFHEGADNPTAFVWTNSKGFAYCFSRCNKAYSLFDIVMKTRGLSFPESIGYLADLVDFDIEYTSRGTGETGKSNREFLSQVRKAKSIDFNIKTEPFSEDILNTFAPRLHSKLREEGFDNDTRDYFGLGFATTGYLTNRITVPIDDIDGNIISVSGRSLLDEDEIDFTGEKKYKIWYDTDKGKTLYNISRALPYIELLGEVIVVEGFKSVWRLHQYGIDNVVAVMGSTMTKEQKILLLKLNCKVVIIGDNDDAGALLNKQVMREVGKFTDVSYVDMFLSGTLKSSSPAELSKAKWEHLYKTRKDR